MLQIGNSKKDKLDKICVVKKDDKEIVNSKIQL